jgi:hypothetical protein
MNSREAASIPVVNRRLSASERFRWQPEKAPHGSLSIMVSDADRLLLPTSCRAMGQRDLETAQKVCAFVDPH